MSVPVEKEHFMHFLGKDWSNGTFKMGGWVGREREREREDIHLRTILYMYRIEDISDPNGASIVPTVIRARRI